MFSSAVSSNEYNQDTRVLVWSLRNIQNFVFNTCLFEFEDIIAEVDSVDIYSPPQYDLPGKVINRLVKDTSRWIRPFSHVNPYRHAYTAEHEYDVFFCILDFPLSIASINSFKDLHKKCKFAVCYMVEIWNIDLPKVKHFIEFFDNFDLIVVGTAHSNVVENVKKITGLPCEYLAPGVNAAKFYPDLDKPRPFDVCSLGRRSSVTHEALLALAEDKKIVYYYDAQGGANLRRSDYQEHRTFTSTILKNSRYFIANHAKINQPNKSGEQHEIGYRFFEGVAAGSILLGKPPQVEAFDQNFDWPNAVIPIKFDEPDIGNVIANLDSQPALLKEIQTNNVVNSLLKHDWVYRWERILEILDLPPMQAMENRKFYLRKLAQPALVS